MERTDIDRPRRGSFAALAFLVVSVALGGCATPSARTQLDWPTGTTYRVHAGDTLSEIADRYRTSENAFARYNDLDNPNRIYAGQVLRVPPRSYVASARPAARPRYRAPQRTAVARRKAYVRRAGPEPQRVQSAQAYAAPLRFVWPVNGRVISSFGRTPSGGRNDGINIAAREGAPVRAAAGGRVIYAGDELKGYGNLVLIRHEDGYVTAYAHAERLNVARGEAVKKGQVIGYAGTTGDVSRPQLHFEIRRGAQPVDPKPLLMASN